MTASRTHCSPLFLPSRRKILLLLHVNILLVHPTTPPPYHRTPVAEAARHRLIRPGGVSCGPSFALAAQSQCLVLSAVSDTSSTVLLLFTSRQQLPVCVTAKPQL